MLPRNAAAGAAHRANRHACVCECCSALRIDLLGSVQVRSGQRLTLVLGVHGEDGHGVLQAVAARGVGCGGQGESDRSVVGVRIARVLLIGDCVGETVVASLVALEACGLVDWFVGDEAGVGLSDKWVLVCVVGAAIRVGDELGGQSGHKGLADWE